MTTIEKAKLKRLRECEDAITVGMEDWYRQGLALKEIKEDELYRADSHESFAAYLRARPQFGYSERRARAKIAAAELRQSLPTGRSAAGVWSIKAVEQLNRLPTTMKAKQIATLLVENVQDNGRPITEPMVRKAVDKVVGKRRKPKKQPPTIAQFLRDFTFKCDTIAEAIEHVPDDVLKDLADEKPATTKELADAVRRLDKALDRLWRHLPG